jgi:hypothetical protein
MKIRSVLPLILAAVAIVVSHPVSAQLPATSDTGVNDRGSRLFMTEGVLRVNGVLYIVSAGIAKRIDLVDGQMATMDGLVKAIPAHATLPGGVPQATATSGASAAPAGRPPTKDPIQTTATGATNTPQSERNKGVGDPTPGSSTPSTK